VWAIGRGQKEGGGAGQFCFGLFHHYFPLDHQLLIESITVISIEKQITNTIINQHFRLT
jgi:hypothetical protein